MEKDDLILYAGLAALAYALFYKKPVVADSSGGGGGGGGGGVAGGYFPIIPTVGCPIGYMYCPNSQVCYNPNINYGTAHPCGIIIPPPPPATQCTKPLIPCPSPNQNKCYDPKGIYPLDFDPCTGFTRCPTGWVTCPNSTVCYDPTADYIKDPCGTGTVKFS